MKPLSFVVKSKWTLLFSLIATLLQAQNFTAGRIIVSRVGDPAVSLTTNTAPVSLLEFDPTTSDQTTPSKIVNFGSSTGNRLTVSGTTANEGQLSLSTNGNYLHILGYDFPTATATPTTTTVNKVIGRIGFDGTIDYTTNFPTSANGTAKSVVSADGTRFWTLINNIGTVTFGQTGANPTQVASSTSTMRTLNIYNGQLYYLTGFGNITSTTTALPTGSTTMATAVPLSPQLSANGFVFLDLDPSVNWNGTGYDVLYLTHASKGIEKYYFDVASASWLPANSQYSLVITLTNGGSGYTSTPTVTIGTTWTAGVTYTLNQQILGTNGRLYTVSTAGTSGTVSP